MEPNWVSGTKDDPDSTSRRAPEGQGIWIWSGGGGGGVGKPGGLEGVA